MKCQIFLEIFAVTYRRFVLVLSSELTTTSEARLSSFADNLQDLLRGGLFPFDSR